MSNRKMLQSLLRVTRDAYDDDALRALIERDPKAALAASGCDDDKLNPLHETIRLGASIGTILLLCDACPPEALEETDSDGDTALHLACGYGATLDVIGLLHERCPDAIGAANNWGNTPLHIACYNSKKDGPLFETVKYLVDAYPDALAARDSSGCTPLAAAIRRRTSDAALLAFLVEKHPRAAGERNDRDLLPLHDAICQEAPLKVVTLLVDAYPAALEDKRRAPLGNTPLHLACKCEKLGGGGSALDIAKLLIERCPESVEMRDGQGRTPLQCAKGRTDDSSDDDAPPPSPQLIEVLTTLQSLDELTANDPRITDALLIFGGMGWTGGVNLVLDAFPSAVNRMEHGLMPAILASVGRREGTLGTLYSIIRDNPVLAAEAACWSVKG